MTNEKSPKNPKNYSCEFCYYFTSNKKDYNKHLLTRKHKILTNTNEKSPKIPKTLDMYECECGKKYKHTSSLCKHKRTCTFILQNQKDQVNKKKEDFEKKKNQEKIQKNENMIDYKEMFVQMVDQNNELQKTIHEMIPKLGNTTYSQNNTQNFNINVFLNEQCKDALNIMDFVNSLQLQLKDLENTGKLGFVEGTSKIIIDGLKELEINKRPIHCSDIQKEILYVKDNDTWEQDDTKNKMKMAIDQINKANMKQIPKWITENPTYAEDEEYMKIISNIMKADIDDDKNKIINNVAKETIIE